MISDLCIEDARKRLEQVACDEARPVGAATAASAEPRRRRGCQPGVHALGEKRRHNAGEDVAGSGGRQRRAPAADERAGPGRPDQRVRTLQEDDAAETVDCASQRLEPVGVDPGASSPSSRPSSPACGVSTVGACRSNGSSP